MTYVNSREAQLCTNIKNAGIEIYTVIFRETDQATENLMRNCASSAEHFYRADNAAELARSVRRDRHRHRPAAPDALGVGSAGLAGVK